MLTAKESLIYFKLIHIFSYIHFSKYILNILFAINIGILTCLCIYNSPCIISGYYVV